MANLTTTEINALAAIVTGAEPTRSANKDKAIAKLAKALEPTVTAKHAERVAHEIASRPDLASAEATLRSVLTTPKGSEIEKPARSPRVGKRASMIEAAQRGELPAAPDFSAETHKRFRKKLDAVANLVVAGDIDGLKAFEINPGSSSPKAIARYRDLAVIALEARRAGKTA